MQNRFMTRGLVIAVSASAFIGSVAFGQMKYSRPRSQQSPTATPTPLPVIPPKETGIRSQPQRTTPTPTPSRQAFGQSQMPMQRPTPTAAPVPAKQAYSQIPRTGAAPVQPQVSPMPNQRVVAGPNQPRTLATPAPVPQKPTPTPVPPPDIQAYLNRQLKDGKFHLNANGKDLALTPFHVWRQKEIAPNSTSTCVDMRSDEGRIYDIDFVTTGKDVTAVRVHRINGEVVR